MAYDILAGKELSCIASKVEIANEDNSVMEAFERLTFANKKVDKNIASTSNMNFCDEMPFDDTQKYFAEDIVYCIDDNGEVQEISRGQPPSLKHFDCSKVLKKIKLNKINFFRF